MSHQRDPVGEPEVLHQLRCSGYLSRLTQLDLDRTPFALYAKCDPVLVSLLRGDPRFQLPIPSPLHADLGPNRIDFRAYKGMLGPDCPGSLQIIVSQWGAPPWNCYADVDAHNVEDAVEAVQHWTDVLRNKLKGWFA